MLLHFSQATLSYSLASIFFVILSHLWTLKAFSSDFLSLILSFFYWLEIILHDAWLTNASYLYKKYIGDIKELRHMINEEFGFIYLDHNITHMKIIWPFEKLIISLSTHYMSSIGSVEPYNNNILVQFSKFHIIY